jgi:hypothetical protein
MSGLDRDQINKIIQDNWLFHGTMALGVVMDIGHLERFAALVAAAEREACAKVCEQWEWANNAADAIRARGNDAA